MNHKTRISSVSSTESSYVNNYDFNTLPTFASSKRSTQQTTNNVSDTSIINHELNDKNNVKDLPFVTGNQYSIHSQKHQPLPPVNNSFFTESRLPSTKKSVNTNNLANKEFKRISSNEFVRKFSKKSLFGTRDWSTSSNQYRNTIKRNNYQYDNDDNREADSSFQFATEGISHLLVTIGALVYTLFSKLGKWSLFFLNYLSSLLLNKVRTIPNPDIQNFTPDQNDDTKTKNYESDNIFRESTPLRSLSYTKEREMKNPLFYKKLKEIDNIQNNNDNERISQAFDGGDYQQHELTLRKPKKQYGTFFFKPETKPNNILNLEASYLKTAMNPESVIPALHSSQDIYSKSNDIKESLIKLSNSHPSNPELNDSNGKSLIMIRDKPSFTRSTNRFKDLEWLVDDKEDYLNNLEATKLFKEYQNIIAERKKIQQLRHLAKLKQHGLGIRPLDEAQLKEVENTWIDRPSGILASSKGVDITALDLFTLSDRHWLNDNIIDYYLNMIKEYVNSRNISQVHVFTTFFYTTLKSKGYNGVKKWAKRAKVDVSKLDYIFVPVNLNQTHWALAVIDNINEKFTYIDSLYGNGTDILIKLQDYMTEETRKTHGDSMNGKNYNNYEINGDTDDSDPVQQNGYDCGVFTCTAVDYYARNRELDYSQADMPLLRRRMAYEILHNKLLSH